MVDRALAGHGLEVGVAVVGNVHDAGVPVGVGERVEDAGGASVGGKDAGEPVIGAEEDDRGIGVPVEGNVDGRKEVLSKCLRDISRPVIRRP